MLQRFVAKASLDSGCFTPRPAHNLPRGRLVLVLCENFEIHWRSEFRTLPRSHQRPSSSAFKPSSNGASVFRHRLPPPLRWN